ncbi:MAG: flagellar export chaperone FlgN [Bdellovibrionota bacterium]
MPNIVELLERKNVCFRNFYKLCEYFLEEIAQGETKNLEDFQRRRQKLIKVIEELESKISLWIAESGADENLKESYSDETRSKISQLLDQKDSLVHSILNIDLQILGHIDRLKSQTIQRLQEIQTGRKTINAYRSPLDSVETAEKRKGTEA